MPHADPGIQRELATLFDAADAIGAKVSFKSASEAYAAILASPASSPPRDLVAEFRLDDGAPTELVGYTVEHRDATGLRTAPPALPPRAARPAPTVAGRSATKARTARATAHVTPLYHQALDGGVGL